MVDFKTEVSACSWTASPVLVGNAAANPTLLAAVTAGVAETRKIGVTTTGHGVRPRT